MNPPIDPKPEEVNNDVQGKVIETAREQEQINFVYGPPAVPATPAPAVLYHQEAMTYGPVTARKESPFMDMAMAMQQNAGKQQEQPAAESAPDAKDTWKCGCGTENTGEICTDCGKKRPVKLSLDLSDYVSADGRPIPMNAERKAAVKALSPEERKVFMDAFRDATMPYLQQVQAVYGPPSAPGPGMMKLPDTPGIGGMMFGFPGLKPGQVQPQPALQKNEWRCACGTVNGRRFCMNCGKPKPETWTCGCCGAENTGKFCMECGKPRQDEKPLKPALTEREKAAAGYLYDANNDAELIRLRTECAKQIRKFNDTMPDETEQQREILRGLLGKTDGDFVILQPFRCDYGSNISIGKNFFSNYNCIILDAAPVTFGDNVFIAPNCVFSAAGHALDAEQRAAGLEIALPITVGDDVWFGANVTVLPGVTIGSNTVIGAGSVVTKDIPSGVVAAGNPCRVLREITDADKQKYPVCEG